MTCGRVVVSGVGGVEGADAVLCLACQPLPGACAFCAIAVATERVELPLGAAGGKESGAGPRCGCVANMGGRARAAWGAAGRWAVGRRGPASGAAALGRPSVAPLLLEEAFFRSC